MTISYVTFMKHAEKVARTASLARPVLKGVCHDEEGNLIVTDSSRLYFAKKVVAPADRSIKDPKTGEVIDGNYPDISRLLPNISEAVYVTELNVNEVLDVSKALKIGAKLNPMRRVEMVKLSAGIEELAKFHVGSEKFNIQYQLERSSAEIKLGFQVKYLTEALALFKDAGHIQVKLRVYGNNRPFTLSDSRDQLTILILPVRLSAEEAST